MNNAEYILRTLEQESIDYFFMVPGKLINPIMSCYKKGASERFRIKPIVAAHEAGAMAMADGYARASHKFGVCMVIDGPGTANAIPFLMAAEADQSPVILISGQIPRDFHMMGAIQDSTQGGISTTDMLKNVCGSSYALSNSKTLPRYLKNAIRGMWSPSKSTAYLSISKDVLLEPADGNCQSSICSWDRTQAIDCSSVDRFIGESLRHTKKVLMIVGARARDPEFFKTLQGFSEHYSIPVATTITSKGLMNENSECSLGLFGYSGHSSAHHAVLTNEAELILLLGYDASQWTSLAWHKDFVSHPNLIQIDKDPQVIGKYIPVREGIVSDEKTFLDYLNKNAGAILEDGKVERKKWIQALEAEAVKTSEVCSQESGVTPKESPIHPSCIVIEARKVFPKTTIALADAGVHRSYAAHYWKNYDFNQFMVSTAYGPMGWAVPASIGVKLAQPTNPVVVFTGDGCMLMSGLEIQTAAKLGLDITFIVFNNGYYGASLFNNLENESYLTRIPQHDWAKVAEGLGLKGFTVEKSSQLNEVFTECRQIQGPKLVDVRCDPTARAPSPIYAETLKTHKGM